MAYFVLGLCPGAFIGILIFRMLPGPVIKLMMGLFTLVMIYLPKSEKESRLGITIFLPLGFLAGLFGIFFGATGHDIPYPFIDISGSVLNSFL